MQEAYQPTTNVVKMSQIRIIAILTHTDHSLKERAEHKHASST
jgi:hypothetical protein